MPATNYVRLLGVVILLVMCDDKHYIRVWFKSYSLRQSSGQDMVEDLGRQNISFDGSGETFQ